MAYFPKIGPFYDPKNEQEFYGEQDGRLRLRSSRERRDSGTGASLRESRTKSRSDKVDAEWSDIVQDNSNLFYVEPNHHEDRQIDPRIYHPAGKIEFNNHSRQSSYQSGSSDSPRLQYRDSRPLQLYDRQSSGEPDSLESHLNERHHFSGNINISRSEKYKQGQFIREDNGRQSGGSTKSDQSYTTFSKYLDSDTGNTRTSQRLPLNIDGNANKVNGSSLPVMNVSQSGKRKSIYMVPNYTNLTEDLDTYTGVVLCERLFGIKLCHYKQKQQRPNGSNIDPVLRERKVIVQGVLSDSQADICAQIHRGDMLVGLNDVDVTWVNIDELFKHAAHLQKVKLTFQVPLVIGPKQPTPPVTPTRSTPPLPPHTPPLPPHIPTNSSSLHPPPVPLRIPLTLPPRPPLPRQKAPGEDLVLMTTGETMSSLELMLKKYLFAVMYLSLGGTSEQSQEDVLYQYPVAEDNKVIEIRGLFLTLNTLMSDITSNHPRLTCVRYKGQRFHVSYWRNEQDVLLICLPENRVPALYLQHILSDLVQMVKMLFGSVMRVFRDRDLHSQLDQVIILSLYRVLMTGVSPQSIQICSPLEPLLLDTLTSIRWLRILHDDKILCDEILSEYEAQDFMEMEDVDPDERRPCGILGSCLFFKDYLLCSHLCPTDLQDVHLFLKYHSLLHLVNKQPVENLVIWREVYPTRLCHSVRPDNPGYREPAAKWFLLIVGMRHFLHCTILEMGSYANRVMGRRDVSTFFIDQSRATLSQLEADDTDIEVQCNARLMSDSTGPTLKCIEADRKAVRPNSHVNDIAPVKSPTSKMEASPRYGTDDGDRLSANPPDGPAMRRHGSKLSFGSNESNGSNGSASLNKGKFINKKGSMYDITALNRSFSDRDGRFHCDIKLSRGVNNLLFHYVSFDKFEGLLLSPTTFDLAHVQSATHEHVLYNFYGCCLKLHRTFENYIIQKSGRGYIGPHGAIEEAVMFTCQLGGSSDSKRPASVMMYWVVGRLFPDNHEMFVCLEDGAPQSLLELAFTYNFGLS